MESCRIKDIFIICRSNCLERYSETRKYIHFLSLSVSIKILLDEDSNIRSVSSGYVEKLLKCFVTNCMEYYGGTFPSYNTHSLLHLCDDSTHFQKPLDDISCFTFENYNQIPKKYVRNAHSPVAQIVKRISELEVCSNRYNKIFIHTVVGTKTDKDTWFLLNSGSFAHVIECKEDGFICDVLSSHHTMNFYSEPLESKLINIF